jgi:hypothetical protein
MCGITTLLAHFHLALKGGVPFQNALNGGLADLTAQSCLLPRQIGFITFSASLAKRLGEYQERFVSLLEFTLTMCCPCWLLTGANRRLLRTSESCEDDMYWISQRREMAAG